LKFKNAEVMIPVHHYAKTMFSINLTAIGNAEEVTQFWGERARAANEENTADAIEKPMC
jgi:hypothetical protein